VTTYGPKFEVLKDKCEMLDRFTKGQEVNLSFDIRGNEYNGKYYVNLNCWKLQAGTNKASEASTPFDDDVGAPDFEPSGLADDDIPF
jgi:hypothetical protein